MLGYPIPRDVYDEMESLLFNFKIEVSYEKKEADRLQRNPECSINLNTLKEHISLLCLLLQQAKIESFKLGNREHVCVWEDELEEILIHTQKLGMDLIRADENSEVWELNPKVRHSLLHIVDTMYRWKGESVEPVEMTSH